MKVVAPPSWGSLVGAPAGGKERRSREQGVGAIASVSGRAATCEGSVKLTPETDEDMWELYNIIEAGDIVRAMTFRKVKREDGKAEAGGKSETTRVKMTLSVVVVEVDFDFQPGGGSQLRLRGTVTADDGSGGGGGDQSPVRAGSYHTLEIEQHRVARVTKVNGWDGYSLLRLRSLADPSSSADLAVLLITEGLATLMLVGGSITSMKGRVEVTMPRKRGELAAMGYERAMARFKEGVLQLLLGIDVGKIKCLVLAGPGAKAVVHPAAEIGD